MNFEKMKPSTEGAAVATHHEYREKRYRSVWFREAEEYYGASAATDQQNDSKPQQQPLSTFQPNHNGPTAGRDQDNSADVASAARTLGNQEPAGKSAGKEPAGNTAAIPLELSRLETGERRSSLEYPAQLSRTSLLGKPLKAGKHRGPRYRRTQAVFYNFLERPRGFKSFAYHFLL
ncbi:hypothetical protein JTE90_021171 [Oedothorax gibbosus]|uniref:Uncharacterized protein n=1 Tax=Oedothorax gibbosus TaxID=931172 RepID=A0AAV6V7D8_9ARAC|nr:hypothetical protein JTE90_021171 [Oedothorax gibbosus]